MQGRFFLLAACALVLAARSVDARMARTNDRSSDAAQRSEETEPHTYFALIKGGHTQTDLALLFKERLGGDKNVRVSRASPNKMVVKMRGNQAFVDRIKSAIEAFPEVRARLQKHNASTRAPIRSGEVPRIEPTGNQCAVGAGVGMCDVRAQPSKARSARSMEDM